MLIHLTFYSYQVYLIKNQLNEEVEGFFRLIKLKAYFKDKNMYNPTNPTFQTKN